MIIKKVKIENFLSYFDNKTFEFSNGLNIILGENGEGKTKFFDAVEWLLQDNNTEKEVMQAINNLDKELTIFIVAHRLTTLRNCDEIFELVDGKIISRGNYASFQEKQ